MKLSCLKLAKNWHLVINFVFLLGGVQTLIICVWLIPKPTAYIYTIHFFNLIYHINNQSID